MFRSQLRALQLAGSLALPVLLVSTPTLAQQTVHSVEPPKSIISLAAAPKPGGFALARRATDATFEHAPANYHVFAAATAGSDAGVEPLTLNFAAETTLTRIESKNKDFVVEPGGTCHVGNHYSRGGSCALLVRFNPQGPGHRLGFLSISHTAEPHPMNVGLTGNGYAPVVSFTPSRITTVAGTAGTINAATSLAVDGGDIVYIADTGNALIKEIDSSGSITPVSPFFGAPASLAVDSSGMIYVSMPPASFYTFGYIEPWGSQTGIAHPYAAGTCTPSSPCFIGTVGLSIPANLSMDANDNLFFEEGTKGAAEMPVADVSGGGGAFNLWYLTDQFSYAFGTTASFAVDASGNLYNSFIYPAGNLCYLVTESLYSAESTPTANRVAGGAKCGFSGDKGQARGAEISSTIGQIAFDAAGNLYFADAGNQRIRRIDALTGIISTVAGNGTAGIAGDAHAATMANLSNPTGVGVDSQGQIYILSNSPVAGPTQSLRKVDVNGSWSYGNVLRGGASIVKVFTVSNTGNDTLALSSDAALAGNNPGDFALDPGTTSCVLSAGSTLLTGHSCNIGIVFKPTAAGSRTATLRLMDNTVTGTNQILLDGVGTLPPPTLAITAPVASSSVKNGTVITFSVSVTSASGTQPTGTVTFKVNGAAIGSPVALSGAGLASTTFTEATIAAYTLSAVYSGDSNFTTITATETLNVTAVAHPVTITLSTAPGAPGSCGASNFVAHVSSSTSDIPTGTVHLQSQSYELASAALTNGGANLTTTSLAPCPETVIAVYSGDGSHYTAVSAPLKLMVSPWHSNCVKPPMPLTK